MFHTEVPINKVLFTFLIKRTERAYNHLSKMTLLFIGALKIMNAECDKKIWIMGSKTYYCVCCKSNIFFYQIIKMLISISQVFFIPLYRFPYHILQSTHRTQLNGRCSVHCTIRFKIGAHLQPFLGEKFH